MDVGRSSPPLQARSSGEDRLDSWKEIAEYLKRSVRTVRRWKADENLPVHRHIHQAAGTVYAFKAELDTWLASRTPPPFLASQEEAPIKGSVDPVAILAGSPSKARRVIVVITVLGLAALLAPLGALRFRSEVTHGIGEAVAGKLPPLDPRRESQRVDPDAYRLFVKGLVAASADTYEGFRNAGTYFQQAIEKDPTFAAAYARTGLNYLQYSFYGTFQPNQFMPQAESAARKSVELDDDLAEAHAVLGTVLYRYRWDWSNSEKEFRQALALNPNYVDGHRMFSAMLSVTGRPREAIAEARRARDLDPLTLQGMLNLGQAYRAAGAYDLALAQFRAGLERDPRRPRVHFQLGITYLEKGVLTEGIRELETAVALSQRNVRFLGALAYAYARSGRTTDARTILAELETLAKNQYVAPTTIARIYLGLDDRRTAHAWIERAYQGRDTGLVLTAEDIGLVDLQSDPDFHDVFSRLGLAR